MVDSLQEIVNSAAFVCRKYALWDAEGFAREFQGIDDSIIHYAWSTALNNVKDEEIIKVSSRREITQFIGDSIISEIISKPEYKDDEKNFTYLVSRFDDSRLNLAEEDREREIRRLLAHRYFSRSRRDALEIEKYINVVTACKS